MNAIKDTFSALVRRRLWPVAVLLVAALVAVPMVLAKTPATEPPPPAPKTSADDTTVGYVTLASAEPSETKPRRRVLGARKDPFEPKPLPKVKKAKKTAEPEATATPTSTPAPATSGGGTASPPASAGPTPTPSATVPASTIRVRFGKSDSTELEPTYVERFAPLPDEETPVLVYRGLEKNGKVAVFELTGKVEAQGDGVCVPTPEDCQYLKLRAGETEFITVTETGDETDAQYQLDLVRIYTKRTKVKAEEDGAQPLAKGKRSKLK